MFNAMVDFLVMQNERNKTANVTQHKQKKKWYLYSRNRHAEMSFFHSSSSEEEAELSMDSILGRSLLQNFA